MNGLHNSKRIHHVSRALTVIHTSLLMLSIHRRIPVHIIHDPGKRRRQSGETVRDNGPALSIQRGLKALPTLPIASSFFPASLLLILLSWRPACEARTKVKTEFRVFQRNESRVLCGKSLYFGRSAAYIYPRLEDEISIQQYLSSPLTQKSFLVKRLSMLQHVIDCYCKLMRQLRPRSTKPVPALQATCVFADRIDLLSIYYDLA